ncbi:Uncharacterized membrane protein YckC, RDD family [Granulicella pectinivorans]|uniref:Uncharacterized membrane protein YckC, RDD family n=1 Tax=Granulicella pectinivorans TaxID=474950 RepID=A0A1I6L1P4_9BACT|nr:RDD family protein [Granulicella pectinivorans]SFR97352.1 Uncharacterized membrane protein YckC, RDD family [Granulicella pectinivorans]
MSAAQLDMSEQDETFGSPLKQQVAERLASHRSRRMRMSGDAAANGHRVESDAEGAQTSRAAQIAAAVAARYAESESYRVYLAAEAEKAMAAAAVAARSAQAIAQAQRELLDELDAQQEARSAAPVPVHAPSQVQAGGFKVRLYEDVGRPNVVPRSGSTAEDIEESRALDEELEFRLSPDAEHYAPAQPIPGNLLEFPRQLVAARKARPRYAEGPLAADAALEQEGAQLRIFEVNATQITAAPVEESAAPEWSSIYLEAPEVSVAPVVEEAPFSAAIRPQTAPMSQRAMAALVDGALIAAGFVAFATVVVYRMTVMPAPLLAAGAAAIALAALFLIYRMLFFTFADCTPGMRYARIGLCTFADDNPTRAAMRRRTFAILLAACPLGLGFLWACLDEDRLGWHDRISRMYPRAY